MSNQEFDLFMNNLLAPHSRRHFFKRASALGLSTTAITALLAACGGTTTTSSSIPVGPIDMQTLISSAKKEGKLQAIGIPPEWADYSEILAGYSAKYVPAEYKAEAEFSSAQ